MNQFNSSIKLSWDEGVNPVSKSSTLTKIFAKTVILVNSKICEALGICPLDLSRNRALGRFFRCFRTSNYSGLILKAKNNFMISDCPCGDMTWMPAFLHKHTDIDYTGYDLIPQNIEKNQKKFKNESWKFQQFDMIKTKIGSNFVRN